MSRKEFVELASQITNKETSSSASKENPFQILLLDGAMGTILQTKFNVDISGNLWTLPTLFENPEIIERVHKAYLGCGADIITTCSYQVSDEVCARYNNSCNNSSNSNHQQQKTTTTATSDRKATVSSVVKKSIEIAKQSVVRTTHNVEEKKTHTKLIFGSVASYGASLVGAKEYSGEYPTECCSKEFLINFHSEIISTLYDDDEIDCVLLETQPRLDEVLYLLNFIQEINNSNLKKENKKQKKVAVSFQIKKKEQVSSAELNLVTGFGDNLHECFSKVLEFDFVVAVGVNCCFPCYIFPAYQIFDNVVSERKRKTHNDDDDVFFLCYPNSGEQWISEKNQWSTSSSQENDQDNWFQKGFVEKVLLTQQQQQQQEEESVKKRVIRIIVGGCCRTTDEEIGKLRKVLDAYCV